MIQVKGIHKSFEDNHVLKGVDVDFHRGETNLIIGSSGSGKTVFLKTILGLHQPDQGQIIYDGEVLSEMSKQRAKKLSQEIGMLFQGGALFDSMTVAQNIRFPLEMFSEMTEHQMDERVKFVMNRVRLECADSKFPSEISGGMQKRVSIARAISMSPKYLFCDEPNSGLDPETADATVTVVDVLGQIVYASNESFVAGERKAIDLSNNAKGMYILSVEGEGVNTVERITIK